jgi:phosphoribosylanthranilate isomerase
MVFVKICGITNLEDARWAIEAGADALGFNFFPRSPRFVLPSVARNIIEELPSETLTVGVFVNENGPEAVEAIASEAGVTALQLHGDESPAFCEALGSRFVIKVLAMGPGFDSDEARKYHVPAFMIDVFDRKRRGGTGRTVDWSAARQIRALTPKLFLAGGLSPENVAEAIATVEPYAVDACSALEVTPGKKDPQRVRAFIEVAHAVRT